MALSIVNPTVLTDSLCRAYGLDYFRVNDGLDLAQPIRATSEVVVRNRLTDIEQRRQRTHYGTWFEWGIEGKRYGYGVEPKLDVVQWGTLLREGTYCVENKEKAWAEVLEAVKQTVKEHASTRDRDV